MSSDDRKRDDETETGAAASSAHSHVDLIEAVEDSPVLAFGNADAVVGDGEEKLGMLLFSMNVNDALALQGPVAYAV